MGQIARREREGNPRLHPLKEDASRNTAATLRIYNVDCISRTSRVNIPYLPGCSRIAIGCHRTQPRAFPFELHAIIIDASALAAPSPPPRASDATRAYKPGIMRLIIFRRDALIPAWRRGCSSRAIRKRRFHLQIDCIGMPALIINLTCYDVGLQVYVCLNKLKRINKDNNGSLVK